MKIRQGFVTNSSSSSFIVAFDHSPKSAKEVQEMLFGPNSDGKTYSGFHGKDYPVEQVAETVWQDIQEQTPNDIAALIEEASYNSHIPYDYFDKLIGDRPKSYNLYSSMSDFSAAIQLDTLIGENEGKVFYIFEYADENGEYYAALEHGNLFERLPHTVQNKH